MCTDRSWFEWRATLACFVLAAGILGIQSSAHDRVSQVTWTTDVEPILRARCVGCHTTGGFGPMPLDTYEDARRWAKAIREEVLERRMPPWPAARGFGAFSNDRSLTPIEIELVTAWADGATPVGPPVAPPRTDPDHGRASRAPDLLVSVAAPHEVGALTERIEVPTALTSDRWIAGWEFQPGNRSILERAVVSVAPGIPIGTWTPPDGVVMYPPGVAQRLPAGSRLILELHYRKSSTPQTDRSGVAFYFGERPRHEVYHRQLPCGVTTIDREMDVLAVTPRVDGGASVEIVARHPDGRVEPLVVVPRYAPAYAITYRFQQVSRLRHDSAIDVRSTASTCGAEFDFIARVAAR